MSIVLTNGEIPAEQQFEEKILSKLAALEESLLRTEPEIRFALVQLDRDLKQRPDLLHILKDEDIGTIFKATQIITQNVIVAETAKATAKGKSGKTVAQLKKTGLEDL